MSTKLIRRAAAASVLLVLAAGCSGSGDGRYIPSESAARQALEVALNAWKGGQEKPGPIAGSTPAVRVVDSAWEAGQRLESFEILKEEKTGSGDGKFTVRLTLQSVPETQDVRYIVRGIDTLWVFRESDAESASGM
jgi:hypothetical protein